MKTCLSILLSLVFALSPTSANAAFVVDTGPGSVIGGGLSLIPSQSLAGYFTLESDTIVSSVEGWIGGDEGGSITVSIFADDPFPEILLFSDGFAPTMGPVNGSGIWQGVFGQSWSLAGGSYWVVFEGTGNQFMPDDVPNPLTRYASFGAGNGGWLRSDESVGVRIVGSVGAAVPEPATWAFMIFGFGAIGGAMRRQRKANVKVSYA